MHLPLGARRRLPVLAIAVLLATLGAGCGKKGTSGPSAAKVRTATAADVVTVLTSHSIDVKGDISCFGQAPGVVDCHGTTSDGKDIQATLVASTSGLSCTGPMVVNVDKTQLASLPDEKCS